MEMIIMVGVPRSGKSTYVKENFLGKDYIVLSRDEIRERIYGDRETIKTREKKVSEVFDTELKENLILKNKIVIDNTSIKYKYRRQFYDLAKEYGYKVKVIFMSTNIEVIKNRCTETNFDFKVALNKIISLDIPNLMHKEEDMYDELITIYTHDGHEIKSIEEELTKLIDYDQNNPHHHLTLGEHLIKASEEFIELRPCSFGMDQYLAVIMHDIGKPYCKEVNEDGSYSFKGHARVSAYILHNNQYPLSSCVLVSLHMDKFNNFTTKYIHKVRKTFDRYGLELSDLADIWISDFKATKYDDIKENQFYAKYNKLKYHQPRPMKIEEGKITFEGVNYDVILPSDYNEINK